MLLAGGPLDLATGELQVRELSQEARAAGRGELVEARAVPALKRKLLHRKIFYTSSLTGC